MWPTSESVLVTGGAGFIGSHLAGKLLEAGNKVIVLDNLSTGKLHFIKPFRGMRNFRFVEADMLNEASVKDAAKSCTLIYHLAARADLKGAGNDSAIYYSNNLTATHNLITALSREKNRRQVVFASTVLVYGEPAVIPTPETYGPLKPISYYGASKLGCEGLLSAYCHASRTSVVILRIVNTVGRGKTRGVVVDFVNKLRKSTGQLEILGDGAQKRSFISIEDCISAFEVSSSRDQNEVEIYNVGSEDQITIRRVAELVAEKMRVENVNFVFKSVEGGRGWKGDVRETLLDVSRLKELGWRPERNSEQAVRSSIDWLLQGETS